MHRNELWQSPHFNGCWFARDVTAAMVVKNKSFSLLWELRDGPLEKLWGGGRGIFKPQEFFFVIKKTCMNFFRP